MKRRNQMKPSTKDEIKGNTHEVKGAVKEAAGKVTNNPNLEAKGTAERNLGKVEKKVGQVEKGLEKKLRLALSRACSRIRSIRGAAVPRPSGKDSPAAILRTWFSLEARCGLISPTRYVGTRWRFVLPAGVLHRR